MVVGILLIYSPLNFLMSLDLILICYYRNETFGIWHIFEEIIMAMLPDEEKEN
jgi:hypothetical protein